jgi:NADPH2:quinone reductase
MKAIVVREFGGPEVLKLAEVPIPEPAAGQVLVRIKAAGVNPVETYIRSGVYARKPDLPFTPGTDGAGLIEAVGSGVEHVKPGDRVYVGGSSTGTYAEYALALESQVHRLSERASFSQGAGVHVPYATAYRALTRFAHARGAEIVLVHGASGGVGIAAVQIARALGMTVIGTAGSDRGRELVKKEGAHHCLNHRASGYQKDALSLTEGRGFDVIIEMLANVNLGADLKLLAMGGRVVVIGSRGEVTINPRELMGRDAAVYGMLLWNIPDDDSISTHAAIVAGLENGLLKPAVGKELPLAEAPAAHKLVMEPGACGKIVLIL